VTSYASKSEPEWMNEPMSHDPNFCLLGIFSGVDDPYCVVCNGESWRLWTDKDPNQTEQEPA